MRSNRVDHSVIDWSRVEQDFQAGATYKQLAQELDVPTSTLYRWMRQRGIKATGRRPRRPPHPPRELAAQLHQQGLTSDEIAKIVDRRPTWVRQVLGLNGRDEKYGERDRRVVELYQAGHMIAEVAELTGVQPTQVGRIVQRAGVSRPRGSGSQAVLDGRRSSRGD